MIYLLPTPPENTPVYRYRVKLSGEHYLVTLAFNHRDERWRFDLETTSEEEIAIGQLIKPKFNFLKLSTHAATPPGQIYCQWLSSADKLNPPGLNDLGASCMLLYWDGVPSES